MLTFRLLPVLAVTVPLLTCRLPSVAMPLTVISEEPPLRTTLPAPVTAAPSERM